MATLTLKEFAAQLYSLVESDENVAALTMPIDYQDSSEDTIALENEYQSLLSQNLFQAASELRKNNPVLETRILDAPKLNLLQTLMLLVFQFAKEEKSAINTSYDNSTSELSATNVQKAIDELNANGKTVNSAVQEEFNKINTSLNLTVAELENDIQTINDTMDKNIGIRFNETAEVVQIYKNGIWQDWLTADHSGIIAVSNATVILSSLSTSTGSDITGGWTPSGAFSAVPKYDWTAENDEIYATTSSNTVNLISLNNISRIDFEYNFDVINDNIVGNPKDSYIEVYVKNEQGTITKTLKVSATSSNGGNHVLSLGTSDLSGMHTIGYKLGGYHYTKMNYSDDGTRWSQTIACRTYLNTISIYTT